MESFQEKVRGLLSGVTLESNPGLRGVMMMLEAQEGIEVATAIAVGLTGEQRAFAAGRAAGVRELVEMVRAEIPKGAD